MSIPASHAPTFPELLFSATLFASAALFIALRVYRPSSIVGRDRCKAAQAAGLAMAMIFGFCTWIGAQAILGKYIRARLGIQGPGFKLSDLTTQDVVLLSTIPYMAGFAALWLADLVALADLPRAIGFGIRQAVGGIWRGLVAALMILPPTYLGANLIDAIYRRVHYQHPEAHELLYAMHEAPSRLLRNLLVISATVLAPLFEEFLFRGHLQTLLKRAFITLSTAQGQVSGFPLYSSVPMSLNDMEDMPRKPPVIQAWLSILITSVMFAAVHEQWTWPPIFLLSVGLGYCYERTGNLWVPMTVHCLFNSVSTFVFLVQ